MSYAPAAFSEIDPVLRVKLAMIAGVFAFCTSVIAYDVIVYQGAPSEAEKAEAERERPTLERGAAETRANNVYEHDTDLASLQAAVAPKPDSRCAGSHRRELRAAIHSYASGRASANRVAARDPQLRDVVKIWLTPEDAEALREARGLMLDGYLLASDFQDWTERQESVFPLPRGVASRCSRSLEEAEKGGPG